MSFVFNVDIICRSSTKIMLNIIRKQHLQHFCWSLEWINTKLACCIEIWILHNSYRATCESSNCLNWNRFTVWNNVATRHEYRGLLRLDSVSNFQSASSGTSDYKFVQEIRTSQTSNRDELCLLLNWVMLLLK